MPMSWHRQGVAWGDSPAQGGGGPSVPRLAAEDSVTKLEIQLSFCTISRF